MNPEEKDLKELPEEEERDLIEATDEDGNTVLLEAERYFFYNGEEYCMLTEVQPDECDCEECADKDEDEQINAYIMRVVEKEENGEQVEEFEVVEDDALYEKLISILEADFADDENIDE